MLCSNLGRFIVNRERGAPGINAKLNQSDGFLFRIRSTHIYPAAKHAAALRAVGRLTAPKGVDKRFCKL